MKHNWPFSILLKLKIDIKFRPELLKMLEEGNVIKKRVPLPGAELTSSRPYAPEVY